MSCYRTTEPVENLGIPKDFFEMAESQRGLLMERDLDGCVTSGGALTKKFFYE